MYEICSSSTVNFSDITEYEECDGSTFAWFITSVGADNTPNTGDENTSAIEGTDYEFVNQTISTNQEPYVQFISPDTYLITQQVTNSCGVFTSEKLLLVKGTPFVELPLESDNICRYPNNFLT